MDAFDTSVNVEDLFKELDENKFSGLARSLAAYRNELMKKGFTRREAMRLVEAHSKFLYDMLIEDRIAELEEEEAMFNEEHADSFDGDVEDQPNDGDD